MKRNNKIIIIFTAVFLVAVAINFIPYKRNSADKVTIYSSIKPGKILTTLEDSLVVHNRKVSYMDKDKNSAAVKLKYSVSVTEDEKNLYDIYPLNEEKICIVTYKGIKREEGIEDIKNASVRKKGINEDILVFSPYTYKLFNKDLKLVDSNVYQNDAAYKLVEDDKSISGVVFRHEIEERYKNNINIIEIKDKTIDSLNLSICLMVKKQTLDTKTIDDIVNKMKVVTSE